MYLKSIEANGFKSFADKLNITLDDKITCIVGPNGSGKSNVVDAVRWVLGEQSIKSLRGTDSMSDVIFSGSKTRKELNVASVSLTFDNSDHYLNTTYDEVSIKRRLYRSGENEYFLNGEKCRLKDITDLFIDSGVSKESFNIIGQGEVDEIINSNSMDRRRIFEEAAGVLKYKKRKEEAIRKLDHTKDNMNRVNDIISELEVSLAPLEEQAKEARVYLEAKDKLKNIEVALLCYDITRINEESSVLKENISKLNEEIMVLNNTTSSTEIDKKKVELLNLEKEISDLNSTLIELTSKEEKLNTEKSLLVERSKYESDDIKVHNNIIGLNESILKLEKDINLVEVDLNNMNKSLSKLEENKVSIEKNITNLELKKNNIRLDISNKERESISNSNKISVLEDFINNGGNLSNATKSVLNNPRLTGVHNIIGNLIEVDSTYAKALEVSLGGSREFIVVDDESVAKNCIIYLKNNSLGRSTFFPLNVIKSKSVDADTLDILKKLDGYLGILGDLVSFDNKYKGVILNQIGNVIVAKDLDSANNISKKISNRYKIVTIDGEVIHVGGSITGGNNKYGRSIITDRGELELLKTKNKEISDLLVQLNNDELDIDNDLKDYNENLSKVKSEIFEINENIKNKNSTFTNLKNELDNVKKELESLSSSKDSLSKKEDEIMKEYYEVSANKEEVAKNLIIKNNEKDRLNNEIEELTAKEKLSYSNLHKLENNLKECEIKLSKNDLIMDNSLNILSEDYSLTYEGAKDDYKLELDVDTSRKEVNKLKSEIKSLGMVNLAAINEYDRINTRYTFLSKQKEDLENASNTLLEIIDEMDSVMKDELETSFNQINDEFKRVFKELFKGGSGELVMTNKDDILNTGIDIIASPPGKKLSTITLLSGGEKTLTAICLLFAILNVRVIPFCLFDEVEAALDDANVENFGEYLSNYKDKTQFLLITHKKKTMEYANTLYGITMQESGVSKLVSVKLD